MRKEGVCRCGGELGARYRSAPEFAGAPWLIFCRACGRTFYSTNYLPEWMNEITRAAVGDGR